MTLCCNCDMPLDIYCDWLQDQGWNVDELREEGDPVVKWRWPMFISEWGNGQWNDTGDGSGFGDGTGVGYYYFVGSGSAYGDGGGYGYYE